MLGYRCTLYYDYFISSTGQADKHTVSTDYKESSNVRLLSRLNYFMNISELEATLKGEPKYRRKQVFEAIYRKLISDWSEATNLSKDMRKKLCAACDLSINAKLFTAKDEKTEKALIELDDGEKIETVLMKHSSVDAERRTVCVSSQVGCSLGCKFCATGQLGCKRNLTADEIVGQVLFFARKLKAVGEKITNIVFMGMGEIGRAHV